VRRPHPCARHRSCPSVDTAWSAAPARRRTSPSVDTAPSKPDVIPDADPAASYFPSFVVCVPVDAFHDAFVVFPPLLLPTAYQIDVQKTGRCV
jgi:hypothetical protein